MKRKIISFVFILVGFFNCVQAQFSGDLDPSFGFDGIVTTAIGDSSEEIFAIVLQPDGKIIAAGRSIIDADFHFTIARYNENGSLDFTFGTDGIVKTQIGSFASMAWAVAIQTDGKIIAGGTSFVEDGTDADFTIVRYNIDGSLDITFGGDGIVSTPLVPHASDQIRSLIIQPDGKIVAGGNTWNGTIGDFAVVRYNSNGTADNTFGFHGVVLTDFGSNMDGISDIALQPDGKIVAAGYYNSDDFALARYNMDGSLDNSFHLDGKLTTHIDPNTREARSLVIQTDGKIIVTGNSGSDLTGDYDFTLVRYNTNGSIDNTFGTLGVVKTHISDSWDEPETILLQEDGKIVVAGSGFAIPNENFVLTRYNINGAIDSTFGTDGIVSTDIDLNNDFCFSAALQPDGKIVIGGWTFNGTNNDFVLARYFSEDVPCIPLAELCNSLDDNCNGLIDDAITESISISAGGPITFCQGGNVLLTATYSGATVQWKKNGTNIPGATSPTYLVTTKGTYTCETTSACNTELSTGIFVNVQKNPPANITAGGATTFCQGGSVVLTANAGGGLSYHWYKGAALIAGATSINYTATIAGNYKCRVTKTATGCFKNSNVINVSVPCKEGELVDDENAFIIYPNPNDGTFRIEANVKTQDFASQELTTIEIYNNLGQLIYSKEANALDGKVNELIEIKNNIPGIYSVKLSNNNFLDIKNIIIE